MAPRQRLTKAWTPAPWQVSLSDAPPQRIFINGPQGQGIAMFFERGNVPGWENAQLAASASELVEVVVGLVRSTNPKQYKAAETKALALLNLLGVQS